MIKSKVPVVDESREFHYDELFFSLTNDKGCINFGNTTFTRISAYEEHELIGKPHNVIRHPDMPRGVFHLFWEYLKAGKTIAAYVKNLAKDGRYYWVLAVAAPCKGGFLSIRIKPSSPMFEAAKKLYAETLVMEAEVEFRLGKKEAAEQSHAFLLERLTEHGYDSYEQFMSEALTKELSSRADIVGKVNKPTPPNFETGFETVPYLDLERSTQRCSDMLGDIFSSLNVFHQLANELPDRRENMAELGPTLSFLALNTHISASRLGEAGATLSVISQAIRSLSKDTDRLIDDLLGRIESLCDAAEALEFNVAVASLESEVCTTFATELIAQTQEERDPNIGEWIEVVTQEMGQRSRDVYNKLNGLLSLATTLSSDAVELSQQVGRMRVAQLNGRIEIAAFSVNGNFMSIFEEISNVVEFALNECDQILSLLSTTKNSVEGLISMESSLDGCLYDIQATTDRIKSQSNATNGVALTT